MIKVQKLLPTELNQTSSKRETLTRSISWHMMVWQPSAFSNSLVQIQQESWELDYVVYSEVLWSTLKGRSGKALPCKECKIRRTCLNYMTYNIDMSKEKNKWKPWFTMLIQFPTFSHFMKQLISPHCVKVQSHKVQSHSNVIWFSVLCDSSSSSTMMNYTEFKTSSPKTF